MGLGVSALSDSDDNATLAFVAAGGFAGLALTVAISDPEPATTRTGMRVSPTGRRGVGVELDPMSLPHALAGVPGRHSLVRVRF